jgi:outer membrane lipoprotein-sorting protein
MKNTILSIAFLFLANSLFSQTIEEIISKYHTAIGGDKWASVKNMLMTANVDAGGMMIPVEVVMMSDGRKYTKINFQGQEIIQGAFDGETVWSTNFMTQKAEKAESDDTENTKRGAKSFPDALLTYKSQGYTPTLLGDETIDGVKCFKIKLDKKTMLSEGKEVPSIEYFYIDAENFVPILTETEIPTGEMKGKIAQTKYSDYQEVDGVMVAFSQSSGIKDEMSQNITFDKVLINTTVDEKTFNFPGN